MPAGGRQLTRGQGGQSAEKGCSEPIACYGLRR